MMFASFCLLVAVCVRLSESTLLKIAGDTAGAGGFQFGVNGGGWTSGIAGTTAGRGELGGHLNFGYAGTGLKIPLVPIIGVVHNGQPGQNTNHQQGQGGHPGYGFVLGGQGSYSLQGQGGFPINFGIPHFGQVYSNAGNPTAQGGKPEGVVPLAGNGGVVPQLGLPGQSSNFGPAAGYPNVPQVPQAGYPNQGGQNQQPGYPNPGGLIPQDPQMAYPTPQIPQVGLLPNQGSLIPPHMAGPYPGLSGNGQPGLFPNQPLPIDPRRNGAKTPEGPTVQGGPVPEPETTQNPDSIEPPTVADEEDAEVNTIPEDNETK